MVSLFKSFLLFRVIVKQSFFPNVSLISLFSSPFYEMDDLNKSTIPGVLTVLFPGDGYLKKEAR